MKRRRRETKATIAGLQLSVAMNGQELEHVTVRLSGLPLSPRGQFDDAVETRPPPDYLADRTTMFNAFISRHDGLTAKQIQPPLGCWAADPSQRTRAGNRKTG